MNKRNLLIFTVSLVTAILASGVSLLLPNQHTAKGLLIITRRTDQPSADFFTYEGNYAQQNAGSYTDAFLSVLQSPNNLRSSGVSEDIKSLSRLVRVKRDSTQTVSLSVKGTSPHQASEAWNRISDAAIITHDRLKINGDPLIYVSKTPNSPVVLKTYPDWKIVFGTTFLSTAVICFSLITIIRYLKEERDY